MEIVSVWSPFVKLFPEARAIVIEVGVSDTSLKTGSELGKVPLAETAWVCALIAIWAELGVGPVVPPVPPPPVEPPVPAAVVPPENGSRPGKTLKLVSWPASAEGGASVSTSWPAGPAGAPAPGVEGAEPGVGAPVVVAGAAVVAVGGAFPPVIALNVFGPCQAMRPRKTGTSRKSTFFCLASFCFRRAAAAFFDAISRHLPRRRRQAEEPRSWEPGGVGLARPPSRRHTRRPSALHRCSGGPLCPLSC